MVSKRELVARRHLLKRGVASGNIFILLTSEERVVQGQSEKAGKKRSVSAHGGLNVTFL